MCRGAEGGQEAVRRVQQLSSLSRGGVGGAPADRCPRGSAEPTFAAKLGFLAHEAFPGGVRAIETHMAWVFLTHRHAYKMKKPVRLDRIDFRSLERRRRVCLDEVRLNRRLAGDVYIGVVPLAIGPGGCLALDGGGVPVEWLVKMRRLPESRMLDSMLAAGVARADDLRSVGRRLGRFFAGARRCRLSGMAWRTCLQGRIDANRRDLRGWSAVIDAGLADRVAGSQRRFLRTHAGLFDERVAAGHVIDGHGDLRPEHICLLREPVIIDCIEFSTDLRRCDSASDLAFLALELERAGAVDLEAPLLDGVASGETAPIAPALHRFYKSLHASTRARLALRHLTEPRYAADPKWAARATGYLHLALRNAP